MKKFFGIFHEDGTLRMLVNPAQIGLISVEQRRVHVGNQILDLDRESLSRLLKHLSDEGIT